MPPSLQRRPEVEIDNKTLLYLGKHSGIDYISTRAFQPDNIYLHKDKFIGIYIVDIGLVLEPVFLEIMRFGDIIKVALELEKKLVFGGYSISSRCFVIPPVYKEYEFWNEFVKY